jgi:tRNA(Ile2) C34 agmatinyltransferase TiaS
MFDFGDTFYFISPEFAVIILTMAELGDGQSCPECDGHLERLDDKTFRCAECHIDFRVK